MTQRGDEDSFEKSPKTQDSRLTPPGFSSSPGVSRRREDDPSETGDLSERVDPSTRPSQPVTASLDPHGQNTSITPKFETLSPLTVRLRHDQVVLLTEFERKIMSRRNRDQRRERITKSTLIRVLVDLLPDLLSDTEGIADEAALSERLRVAVSK